MVMVFGQLTSHDSLRNLIVTIDAHKKKSYTSILDKMLLVVIFPRQTSNAIVESLEYLDIILLMMLGRSGSTMILR